MSIPLLLVAALIAYLYFTKRLTARLLNRLVTGAVALIALRFGLIGQPLAGVALAAVGAVFWLVTGRADARLRSDEARARALLGIDDDAGEDEVRAAHRRLASGAHPDRGGSTGEMQALNAARDLLLKRAKRGGRPSA